MISSSLLLQNREILRINKIKDDNNIIVNALGNKNLINNKVVK